MGGASGDPVGAGAKGEDPGSDSSPSPRNLALWAQRGAGRGQETRSQWPRSLGRELERLGCQGRALSKLGFVTAKEAFSLPGAQQDWPEGFGLQSRLERPRSFRKIKTPTVSWG